MEFVKISAPSLKELFVRQLENTILSGKMQIGEQLPSERDLAERMEVSRTVVNAGICELARKGFLEIRPRIGTFVADYRRYGSIDTLVSIMNYNGGMLCKTEIRSIIEMRMVLDRLTIIRSVETASDSEIVSLNVFIEKLCQSGNPATNAEIAFEFHHELSMMSGNSLLPLLYTSFKLPILSLWERYCRLYGTEMLYQNTLKLYTFLKARDAANGIAWIEEYLSDTINGKTQIYND